MELQEKELLDLIASGEAFVLKVFMDDCPFCVEFAPVFEAAKEKFPGLKFVSFNLPRRSGGTSEFKKLYMTANGKERIAAPATMLFQGKELKARQYGKMSAGQLEHFIKTGKGPEALKEDMKNELLMLFAKKGEILTLGEQLPQINTRIVELQQELSK